MKLLDLFCGGGGCSVGYSRAGFTEIVGIDLVPQPRYPFRFIEGDALEYLAEHGHEFDAVHASPPCKKFNVATNIRRDVSTQRERHLDLLTPTRELLQELCVPYVLENVPGAPMRDFGTLCGVMFGLKVLRHRQFETSFPVDWPAHIPHQGTCQAGDYCTVAGMGGAMKDRRGNRRKEVRTVAAWRAAMGISWMSKYELTQAIPPAYCHFIGTRLITHIQSQVLGEVSP